MIEPWILRISEVLLQTRFQGERIASSGSPGPSFIHLPLCCSWGVLWATGYYRNGHKPWAPTLKVLRGGDIGSVMTKDGKDGCLFFRLVLFMKACLMGTPFLCWNLKGVSAPQRHYALSSPVLCLPDSAEGFICKTFSITSSPLSPAEWNLAASSACPHGL